MTTLYKAADHRVWLLEGTQGARTDFVDDRGVVWRWDGRPFDPILGPDMEASDLPLAHEPLVALANCVGLHGDTSKAGALPPRRLRDDLDQKIAAAAHRRTSDGWRPVTHPIPTAEEG